MEYDSVLDQQSISGKNVSLILCVWKPGYMKSGHKWKVSGSTWTKAKRFFSGAESLMCVATYRLIQMGQFIIAPY